MKIALLLVVAGIVLPSQAFADSDGYYCVGRGYLAFETRLATTPATHELHVVRFSSAAGIVAAQPVVLDDFQVHGMRCLPSVVEVVGWETTQSVDIPGSGRPSAAPARSAPHGAGQATAPGNLGHWAKPQVVTLDAEGEHQFQLVIARASQRVSGGIEHHTVSRVIQRGVNHRAGREIIGSHQLFEGVFLETVD